MPSGAAIAMPVIAPGAATPGARRTDSAVRGPPTRACSSSQLRDVARARAPRPSSSKPCSADSGSETENVEYSRSRSTRNCSVSNNVLSSVAVPLAELEIGRREIERDVATQLGELPVAHHVGEVLAQRVAGLARAPRRPG